MGSVNRITKSFADGFSSIHMDKPHNRQRLKMRFRGEKGFLGGLKRGMKMTGYGFKEGVTGLYRLPAEGAKKEGVWGGVKGTIKGVVGLVAKPVAGILDGVSGIAGGVGQGVKGEGGNGREGGSNWRRIRKPRAFYGTEGSLRNYKTTDAQVQAALSEVLDTHNLDGLEGVIETYVKTFNNPKLLAFSKTYMLLIDARTNIPEFLVTQNSFRGFRVWNELSHPERTQLKNLKFDEFSKKLDNTNKGNNADVYVNFKNYEPETTPNRFVKKSAPNTRKSVKFGNVVDQDGQLLHEISQLDISS